MASIKGGKEERCPLKERVRGRTKTREFISSPFFLLKEEFSILKEERMNF